MHFECASESGHFRGYKSIVGLFVCHLIFMGIKNIQAVLAALGARRCW